jgi:hypothetical protein
MATSTTDGDPMHVSLDPANLLEHMSEDNGILDLKAFQSSNTTKSGQKKKRKRTKAAVLKSAPRVVLPPPSDPELLQALYSTFYALHLSATADCSEEDNDQTFSWKSIQGLFASLKEDTASWCVETKGGDGAEPSPSDFFKPDASTKDKDYRGYCSFLLQKDRSILEEHLSKLPMHQLSPVWSHGDCIWFFFGRNNKNKGEVSALEGRPEHTDSVSHDGTWHFQLSGTKRWFLRPTEELVQLLKSSYGFELDPEQVLQVDCKEGDVLVVNTRLWWHRTELPPQENKPSVSYARDFYFSKEKESEASSSSMTNVDGLYAPTDLEEGVVVFREDDMPECELHRSKEPNCEVVFLEEEESYAVISMRKIKAGEFFCVADSDDDEGEEFDEEEIEFDDDDDGDSDGD